MQRVAILMYHKVGAPVRCARDRALNVTPASFARQVRLIGRLGYRVMPLVEAVHALSRDITLPRRTACFTFDDGYICVRDHAAPILAAASHAATVYVPTAWVGDASRWAPHAGADVLPIMAWEDLRRLRDAGWEIGGHTRSHSRLGALPDVHAHAEIAAGLADTEAALGRAARTFCYPYGDRNERTADLVREAGFIGACTTTSGVVTIGREHYLLPRVKVAFQDGVLGFLYRLLVRPYLG